MFARPHAHHHQIAYVTNDLDGAIALVQRDYGAPGFFVFTNAGVGPEGSPQGGQIDGLAALQLGRWPL